MPASDNLFGAFLDAMLWAETDNSDPETGGEPLDRNYIPEDIHPDTLAKLKADCEQFLADNATILATAEGMNPFCDEAQAGHDFWLTRNGHGAGFWDGDWPAPYGDQLTAAAKAFKSLDVYIGDDGMIHAS